MKARTSVKRVAVAEAAVVKVAAIEITVMESAVTEVSAVRDESVMVEECSTAMPVVSPVAPAPPKASEVPDTKSNTEGESDAAPKNPRHRIPARVGDDGRAVHEPGIIGWHINHLWVGRFDNDRFSLCGNPFLFVAVQMTGFLSLLTHVLDSIGHIFRLVGIRLAE